MKAPVIGLVIACVAAIVMGVWQRQEVKALRNENAALRAEMDALRATSGSTADDAQKRDAELQKLRAEAQELVRLRGEVTQLRVTNKDAEKLRAENQQLRNQQSQASAQPAAPSPTPPKTSGSFPKEQWTFAGYKTPQDALVSAIWSMQQGNARQYFDSLTPDEQLRMTKAWEGKSPEEIAAKQKNDTTPITGIRVMNVANSDLASGNEVMITVMIDGVNRQEQVRMQRINDEWKFGGFIRAPQK